MDLAIQCITKKYATFTGRARRKEYWLFALLYFIVNLVFAVIGGSLYSASSLQALNTVSIVIVLVLFLPSLAVTVRRLHDTDRSGWWVLISLIPVIGTIWLLVLLVLPGTRGSNNYGEDPLGSDTSATNAALSETS
ncbi:MAG: DUF805 domain-containing protein [Alphaproteobacteria bacterium]